MTRTNGEQTSVLKRVIFLSAAFSAFAFSGESKAQASDCAVTSAQLARCAASWEAVFHEGNRLSESGQAYETGYFDGFVLGIAISEGQKQWCPTKGWSSDQVNAIVAKFVRTSPELWQQPPSELVIRALANAFPCAKRVP